MDVKEITDKEIWENFSLSASPNNFLQSWNWGEFQLAIGNTIFRIGIFQSKKLVGICLAVKQVTKFGNYLYVPRGPILTDWNLNYLNQVVVKLKQLAQEENSIFIKIEPPILENPENQKLFKDFVRAVTFVQVEDAWLLDLSKTEEELLRDMRKTTRYLVRNEPKTGVRVEISASQEDIRTFTDLLYETSSRKGFINHTKDYYIKQFEILSRDDEMRIFKAFKDNQILAMAVISFYGEMASYLHGASKQTDQSVGYSLQWAVITEAKRRGMKYYNFWGVVKDKHFYPGHPWYGFSLFKRGFGGFKHQFLRAQDLPLNHLKYYLYRLAEKIRRLRNRVQSGHWED